jgi:hypothetical protein
MTTLLLGLLQAALDPRPEPHFNIASHPPHDRTERAIPASFLSFNPLERSHK